MHRVQAYDVSTTPFACLDYLVMVDTQTPLGKTVLGAFAYLHDAQNFMDESYKCGTPKDFLLFVLVDRIKNRMINFSYGESLSLNEEEVCEYMNGKEKK